MLTALTIAIQPDAVFRVVCDSLAGTRDSRAFRADYVLAVDVGISEDERVATCDGGLFRRIFRLRTVSNIAVAERSYICSGAVLHREIADALLVGSWVPGHLSTTSRRQACATVLVRAVTRWRALYAAILDYRSFCGGWMVRLPVATGVRLSCSAQRIHGGRGAKAKLPQICCCSIGL